MRELVLSNLNVIYYNALFRAIPEIDFEKDSSSYPLLKLLSFGTVNVTLRQFKDLETLANLKQ